MNDQVRSRIMWWLNAKFAVQVTVVLADSRGAVLLVPDPPECGGPTGWTLPRTWMARHESPEMAAARIAGSFGIRADLPTITALAATTAQPRRLEVACLC